MKFFIILALLVAVTYGISRGWHDKVADMGDVAQPIAEKVVDGTQATVEKISDKLR